MPLISRFNRPEYLFRPRAVLRRLRQPDRESWDPARTENVELPWSQEITVFGDEIGHTIIASGIFDLSITETVHRLLDPGDCALDVGANVGYLTNLMAKRAGPRGKVIAFEPHPVVFDLLERNVERWNADPSLAAVEARRLALSIESGAGRLHAEGPAESQFGLSSLQPSETRRQERGFEVELARLDDLFPAGDVQLIKIDVEGHEHSVLQGGSSLFESGGVRDVIFEEHAVYPAPSMTFLEERGMTLFALKHSLHRLDVRPIEEGPAPPIWPGPNYLATRDARRALARLRPWGWASLGGVARLGHRAR